MDKSKCKRCNGTGKMEVGECIYAHMEKCNLCDGTGEYGLPNKLYVCRWSEKLSDCPPPEECSRNINGYCEIDDYKCNAVCYEPQ